eukprot:TRINITY_DN599_c0_g1_i1.p1 TRINITY_DN599_c0_g1~~TRINITY_DN599_c0_g1_i1.p1  ORF type:complete len:478 (-),score=188.22 TRINITY_DN599_c0_g1_i1:33-1343(-)
MESGRKRIVLPKLKKKEEEQGITKGRADGGPAVLTKRMPVMGEDDSDSDDAEGPSFLFFYFYFYFYFPHLLLSVNRGLIFKRHIQMESGRKRIVLPKLKKKEEEQGITKGRADGGPAVLTKRMPVMGEDDSDSDDAHDEDPLSRKAVNRRLQEQQRRAQGGLGGLHAKAHADMMKAMKEDPSLLEYDAVYDSFHTREKGSGASKDQLSGKGSSPKPLFMDKLKKAAALREAEHELAFERQQLREREKEAEELGETEKFVTGAYLKKLEERKKWEDVLREKEAEDEANARKGGKSEKDMRGFWNRMLNEVDDRKLREDSSPALQGGGGDPNARADGVSIMGVERAMEKESKRPRDDMPFVSAEHNDAPPRQRPKTMAKDETLIPKMTTEMKEDGEESKDVWEKKMSDESVSEARRRYLERKRQREEHKKKEENKDME